MTGRVFVFSCALFAGLVQAWGHGQYVQFRDSAGPFQITVFTDSAKLSTGRSQVSVMVQDAPDPEPVLDAQVRLTFSPTEAPIGKAAWVPPACATGAQQSLAAIPAKRAGDNLWLYSAHVTLPAKGWWKLLVQVGSGNQEGNAEQALLVEPALPPWVSYWHLLALPPVAIALYCVRGRIGRSASTEQFRKTR